MRIAIAGASGFLGSALVPSLAKEGHQLLLLGRDPARLRCSFPACDAAGYEGLEASLAGCDALINLAVRNNDARAVRASFQSVNEELVRRLFEAAKTAGVGRFVQLSTFRAIDPAGDLYGQSKRAADDWLTRQSGPSTEIIRLPAVHDGAFGGRLAPLNFLPGPLRPLALVGALRPEVSLDRAIDAILASLAIPSAGRRARITLVADPKQENFAYRALKRSMDIGFALGVILVLWWLLILLWLWSRFSSPGPGIFAQVRVGRERQNFTCFKFRTMKRGTRQSGTHEISASQVTRAGAFMRRLKLDELPQVVNLLRGEMSLVGPRPCLPSQEQLVNEREARGVYVAIPGITGWAQINNIDMSDPLRLARADAEYLLRRSLLFDVKIIVATFLGSGRADHTRSD